MIKPLILTLFLSGVVVAALPAASRAQEAIVRREPGIQGHLAKEMKGSPTTAFSAQDPAIYLIYQGEGLTKGDKIRATWLLEDGGKGYAKNSKISESAVEVTHASGSGEFHIANPKIPGKYRADIFINKAKKTSVKFTIK